MLTKSIKFLKFLMFFGNKNHRNSSVDRHLGYENHADSIKLTVVHRQPVDCWLTHNDEMIITVIMIMVVAFFISEV